MAEQNTLVTPHTPLEVASSMLAETKNTLIKYRIEERYMQRLILTKKTDVDKHELKVQLGELQSRIKVSEEGIVYLEEIVQEYEKEHAKTHPEPREA